MKLIPGKYFLFILAAVLVVALGYMAVNTSNMKNKQSMNGYEESMNNGYSDMEKIEEQSDSDELDSIEKDIMETDLNSIDQELENLGKEL